MTDIIDIIKSINKNSCPNNINLHCHTNYSDGTMSPTELINQAISLQLSHLAITDHHTTQAYKIITESKIHASNINPTLWTGIEISGTLRGCLVHVIGLGFDINNKHMSKYQQNQSLKGHDLKASNIVNTIKDANGLAILAHPARYRLNYKTLIYEAKKIGFDGIEVWYDYDRKQHWTPSEFICGKIYKLAKQYNMLTTCGTDTHGLSILRR